MRRNSARRSGASWCHVAPLIVAIAAALALIGVLLPARFFAHYVVLLVALGVTVWAQGNLMVGDYGVLNGQEIDWSGHDWRNRYELALWLGVPLVSLVFARHVFPTAVFASRILIALQVVLLAYTAAQADPDDRAKWEGAPEAIFELSSKQNVFHFVLDGFQSDAFERHRQGRSRRDGSSVLRIYLLQRTTWARSRRPSSAFRRC